MNRTLPGFGLTLGFTLTYLTLLVLLPLGALVLKTSELTLGGFYHAVTGPRALHAYGLSFGASLAGALINVVFGLCVAWVLARYRFFGRGLLDALVDIPFALPTAVAGIALTAVYSENGLLGRWFPVAFTRAGVTVALVFVGLP